MRTGAPGHGLASSRGALRVWILIIAATFIGGLLVVGSLVGLFAYRDYQSRLAIRAQKGFSNATRKALLGDWDLAPPSRTKWTSDAPVSISFGDNPEWGGPTFGWSTNGAEAHSGETFQAHAVRVLEMVESGKRLRGPVSATSGGGLTFVDDAHIVIGSNRYEIVVSGDRLVTKDGRSTVEWVRSR